MAAWEAGNQWAIDNEAVAFNLPSLPQGVVDFSAGLGDALLFGFGDDLRRVAGVNGNVNTSSASYQAGEIASFAAGASRLTYAGGAKAVSFVGGRIGGVKGAEFAVNSRNSLKRVFRGGLFPNYRIFTPSQIISAKGGTSGAISAAGRTDAALNAAGGIILGGSVVNQLE